MTISTQVLQAALISGISIPDSKLANEITEFIRDTESTLLFNHSSRVYYFGALAGQRRGFRFDAELLYAGAMFHDMGLVPAYSSAADRFEVDGANAARDFLRRHNIPEQDVDRVWTAIALHTTPGIAAYKPLEVELLYNGVALDSLGIGYETFPAEVRTKVVTQFPRVNFKQQIAEAFFHGFEHKPETTVYTCNEDICSHFIRNYKHSNFYDQVQNSPFQNS